MISTIRDFLGGGFYFSLLISYLLASFTAAEWFITTFLDLKYHDWRRVPLYFAVWIIIHLIICVVFEFWCRYNDPLHEEKVE